MLHKSYKNIIYIYCLLFSYEKEDEKLHKYSYISIVYEKVCRDIISHKLIIHSPRFCVANGQYSKLYYGVDKHMRHIC
jgi:hypothetical protein